MPPKRAVVADGSLTAPKKAKSRKLAVPLDEVSKLLSEKQSEANVHKTAPVYLAAVMGYIAQKVLTLAGSAPQQAQEQESGAGDGPAAAAEVDTPVGDAPASISRGRVITPGDIQWAITSDRDLSNMVAEFGKQADGTGPEQKTNSDEKNTVDTAKTDAVDGGAQKSNDSTARHSMASASTAGSTIALVSQSDWGTPDFHRSAPSALDATTLPSSASEMETETQIAVLRSPTRPMAALVHTPTAAEVGAVPAIVLDPDQHALPAIVWNHASSVREHVLENIKSG